MNIESATVIYRVSYFLKNYVPSRYKVGIIVN